MKKRPVKFWMKISVKSLDGKMCLCPEPLTTDKRVLNTYYLPGNGQWRRHRPDLPTVCHLTCERKHVFQKLNTNQRAEEYFTKETKLKGPSVENRDFNC